MVDKPKKRLKALAAERGVGRRAAGNLMTARRVRPGGRPSAGNGVPGANSDIVEFVVQHYLTSHAFNGCPVSILNKRFPDLHWQAVLGRLISESKINVVTSDMDINPHVMRIAPPPIAIQVEFVKRTKSADHACLYPHSNELRSRINPAEFEGRPYALALALGAPQLEMRVFDLAVLETYRNDPRYAYVCDDLHGYISTENEHYIGKDMPERDKNLLQSFGFAYNDKLERFVTTFVCYLAHLSPEHQQGWHGRERGTVGEGFDAHPEFIRTQIIGDFPKTIPISQAFFMEMEVIAEMSKAMGRAPLFRETKRPKRFGLLIRPTAYEFEQFVLLLDKCMSDNIDRKFFLQEVSFEASKTRQDGRTVVEQKGTIQVLEEWIGERFRPADSSSLEPLTAFRDVRRLRQQPAHRVNDDVFEQDIFGRQRDLLMRSYEAVRLIRLILANHPACTAAKVHPLLFEGKISTR
jgi:hypothetical protein